MDHSIIFDDTYHTYDTWHLIPKQRPSIDPPALDYMYSVKPPLSPVNLHAVDDRGVNLNRTATVDFYVENGYDWTVLYSSIMDAVHGKVCKIVLADDPTFYYTGRVTVQPWKSEDKRSSISFQFDCEPFKYKTDVVETGGNTTSLAITADTKVVTPAIVVLTPTSGIGTLNISGLARDKITLAAETIVIKNLTTGTPVTINGIDKTITSVNTNKFADTTMWAFPTVVPGMNLITFSNRNLNVSITYTPRYL